MIFFRYTRFLEKENAQLKDRIEALEARNQELVLSLFNKVGVKVPERPQPKLHKIDKDEKNTKATCSCGWIAVSDDPVELQQKISDHYRQGIAPISKSKSWAKLRTELEAQAENEVIQ